MQRPQNLSAEAEKFIALLEKKAALAEAERIRADARIEQTEIKINQIAAQIKQFEAENKQIAEQNEQLIEELFQLKEKFARAIYRKFCPSAEKYYPGQPNLFDEELESIVPSEETDDEKNQLLFSEPEDTAEGKSRPRSKAGRKPLDKTLPRREIILDISDEDKKCACGSSLVKIGEERSEKLQVIPAQIYVEVTVRPKYACRTCEGSGDEDKKAVRTAALPSSILPKSIATEGLLSFLFTNKFCDHLPYYRQQKAFERIGIYISRQDMSSWQEKVYGKIKPIEKLLIEHLKKSPVIQMDETTARVFGEEDRKDEQKSYMWRIRQFIPTFC